MGARHHSLITADEMMAARTRHQHELDDINRQVALLVQQYTHHIQHSLLTLSHTTLLSSSFVGASPTQPSLDDILPPLPEPKRKQLHNNSNTTKQPINSTTATVASTPTNADDGTKEDEDEVERDAYGVLIKRRRSKLPWRSVLELRSWFADHLQAPYPTDAQRDDLAQRTQLTVKQVQNWFTNTRKRFWAPWVKRQQQAGEPAASGGVDRDSQLQLTHITFDGFSLQGS